jgi:hypothetical protein
MHQQTLLTGLSAQDLLTISALHPICPFATDYPVEWAVETWKHLKATQPELYAALLEACTPKVRAEVVIDMALSRFGGGL